MNKEDEIRLRHMLDAALDALSFAHGKSRVDLDNDRMLVLALVKAIEIIGEAATQISIATQQIFPDIPWADIIGMRHRLVHAYFDINLRHSLADHKERYPTAYHNLEEGISG